LYLAFAIYLHILYIYIYSKNKIRKKVKTFYKLELEEYIIEEKILKRAKVVVHFVSK